MLKVTLWHIPRDAIVLVNSFCPGTLGLPKLIRLPSSCIFQALCPAHQGAHLCTQEVSGSPMQCFTMLSHRFFSILMRQRHFFQHKSVKSNSHYWLQMFILARELLISFNWQQQLSWEGSPKFTLRINNRSWVLPSTSLEEPRSSSNYAWPELFFNLNMWLWRKLYEDIWAKRGQHFQKLEKHYSREFMSLVWDCKFHHQRDADVAVLRLLRPNPFMNLDLCA